MHRKKRERRMSRPPVRVCLGKRGGGMEWKREKKENADLKYTPLSFI